MEILIGLLSIYLAIGICGLLTVFLALFFTESVNWKGFKRLITMLILIPNEKKLQEYVEKECQKEKL